MSKLFTLSLYGVLTAQMCFFIYSSCFLYVSYFSLIHQSFFILTGENCGKSELVTLQFHIISLGRVKNAIMFRSVSHLVLKVSSSF